MDNWTFKGRGWGVSVRYGDVDAVQGEAVARIGAGTTGGRRAAIRRDVGPGGQKVERRQAAGRWARWIEGGKTAGS